MKFFDVFIILAAIAVAQAGLTAQETIENMEGLTRQASRIKSNVSRMSQANALGSGPRVISGYSALLNQSAPSTQAIQEDSTSESYSLTEQEDVCSAFSAFETALSSTLQATQDKFLIFAAIQEAPRMAAVLRGIEGAVDTMASTFIQSAPICAANLGAQHDALTDLERKTIIKFSEIF